MWPVQPSDPLLRRIWRTLTRDLPRIGTAGSRSAELHHEPMVQATSVPAVSTVDRHTPESGSDTVPADGPENLPTEPDRELAGPDLTRFTVLRWIGTVGALMLAFGALGAGALPVVDNPYQYYPGGSLMSRMLQTSSMVVLVGVGLLVVAWIFMVPYVGAPLRHHSQLRGTATISQLRRTFIGWTLPIIFTAPLFTQDIYSYLANGSIVLQGLDPYSAGPVALLGTENPLARSVPFIWSQSASPYGPVALGLAALISGLTNDSILLGVLAHRVLSLAGVLVAGWAVVMLAKRCRVNPSAAFWLGILNPLTILHLVGGIHNESVLLGFALLGLEVGLRGIDHLNDAHRNKGLALIVLSAALISCAGMVKVTGFLALGFVGMALARHLHQRGHARWSAIGLAVLCQILILTLTIAAFTLLSGIGLGWITGQGGAASIRSWMSVTTDSGVIAGWLGMLLGLGDHTAAILVITRAAGVAVAGAFIVRMLFATFRGTIHPVGALGVSTFVLVILFPVVHPWYMLWAIVPLAAWANRLFFRVCVVAYSAAFSFFVLPRGLALPPDTVVAIYVGAAVSFVIIGGLGWWLLRVRAPLVLD
ncbi:polyprenol phosphomannose-dependent alpha 1,6 mannosyltransferase MptB [Corynebacterium sp. A21]|uniref:polyprenol phosphomannose-dependent alpha 1,6 mannosyltransferase MptB n=1 Tax=Corynebacterium sp. A21 TaxID=3457318 RepID=UPI003FD055BA